MLVIINYGRFLVPELLDDVAFMACLDIVHSQEACSLVRRVGEIVCADSVHGLLEFCIFNSKFRKSWAMRAGKELKIAGVLLGFEMKELGR